MRFTIRSAFYVDVNERITQSECGAELIKTKKKKGSKYKKHLEGNNVVCAFFTRKVDIAKLAAPERFANVEVRQLPASLVCRSARCLQRAAGNDGSSSEQAGVSTTPSG